MSRELVWTGFMTLDGVVDSPGGTIEGHPSGGWVLNTEFVPEAFSLKSEELAETSALMFGRKSYEAFAPIWSRSADHASYQDLPKYVVSTTLADDALIDDWGSIEILRSIDGVATLKQGDGGAIFIHGSAGLARSLDDAGLIDRYNLLVYPVLLGSGKRIFGTVDRGSRQLALRESAAYSNGVVKVIYDVVG
ncbi:MULTISPECIES: dihydrofolate reductase family protein [unclassified Arthrobacter]|uniref:dihydrofolate reductase family protein n=1 Tax=unclassified Arthrobacter TaxID=235627 RepID=UPI001492DC2E|nr:MULTISPECIES: dihydrofolate reductase family protein [unclassified Arthrobacter]MBE0009377.1 deaminase [Arthrobacter sp. AET 35A]NOJ63212.1 deaminase [Arthrobacter sp. 147(2020)]